MKELERSKVTLAFVCLALFSISFVMGFFRWIFFAGALLFIGAYIYLDRNYLRCPNCGGFTNLDRLWYAVKHEYHCSHCGAELRIK